MKQIKTNKKTNNKNNNKNKMYRAEITSNNKEISISRYVFPKRGSAVKTTAYGSNVLTNSLSSSPHPAKFSTTQGDSKITPATYLPSN